MPRYFRNGDPAWPRKGPPFRPGIMFGGKVAMVPSRLDSGHGFDASWLLNLNVSVNGRPVDDVLAYDENEGVALVKSERSGELPTPCIIHGKVKALPA